MFHNIPGRKGGDIMKKLNLLPAVANFVKKNVVMVVAMVAALIT